MGDGAQPRVYVPSNPAFRLANDVDHALRTVAIEHGKLSADEAAAFTLQLKKDNRYLRDVC